MTASTRFDPRAPVAVAQIRTLGVQPGARRLAIAGDTAMWAEGAAVVIAMARRAPARIDAGFPIERVEIHPDGQHGFAIGADGRRLAVLDLAEPALTFQLGAADAPRQSMQAGLGRLGGAPVLLAAHKKGELHGYDLAKRAPALWANVGAPLAFRVEWAMPLVGDLVAIIGHHFGDTLDTLEVISMAKLAADPETLENALFERTGIRDSAVRLAAGPCDGAIVVFRDPEDNEERDPDDEDPTGELEGFRGLYLRGLDGALRERIDYDGPIRTGARIGGNAGWIAVECPARIDVIDRSDRTVHSLSGDAVALDPHRLRIARASGELIELFDVTA